MNGGRHQMSKLSTGILGAIAVSLSLGAAQFASGQDLAGTFQISAGTSEAAINRAAKADRAAVVTVLAAPTRTISLRLESLADTSVVIRLPVVQETRIGKKTRSPAAPSLTNSGNRMTVACEPVVSVLTEVAKLLQPGRCVT
jgi:phosphopantothenate synthetase